MKSERVRSIFIIIFSALIGALGYYLYGLGEYRGVFIEWERLPPLPDRPEKILEIGYVQTVSGDIYQYSNEPGCVNDCWDEVETITLDYEYVIPLEACISPPYTTRFLVIKTVCYQWGIGTELIGFAIDEHGNVFSWSHRTGEGTVIQLLLMPFYGAFIGFIVGIIIVMTKRSP